MEDASVAIVVSKPLPTQLLSEIEGGTGVPTGPASRILGGCDPSTVFRLMARGTRLADGTVVKLESVRIGHKWWTSRPAIARYLTAINNPAAEEIAARPAKKRKQKSNSNERLAAMGC